MINKSKFKFVLQKYDYDCGAAAVATILLNTGILFDYKQLLKDLKVTRNGTRPENIWNFFLKHLELKPKLTMGAGTTDLKKQLSKGRIAIVMYQSWGSKEEHERMECGDYAVAAGIEDEKLYLLDPTAYQDWGDGIGWRVMDINYFREKWVDKERNKVIKGWMLSAKFK